MELFHGALSSATKYFTPISKVADTPFYIQGDGLFCLTFLRKTFRP